MRKCPVCNAEIVGRADKKFCSPNCKSANQYEIRQKKEILFYNIDKQLKTNRKILKRFNVKGFTTLRKADVLAEGFDPNYFTHYWKNPKGKVYLFCYEYGFLEFRKDGILKYLLVEWQKYMEK